MSLQIGQWPGHVIFAWDQDSLNRHGVDVATSYVAISHHYEEGTSWSVDADIRRLDGNPPHMLAVQAALFDADGAILDTATRSLRPKRGDKTIGTTYVSLESSHAQSKAHAFRTFDALDRDQWITEAVQPEWLLEGPHLPEFTVIAKVRPGGPPPNRKPARIRPQIHRPALARAGYRHVKALATCQASTFDGTIAATISASATFSGQGTPALTVLALDANGLPVSKGFTRLELENASNADGHYAGTQTVPVTGVPDRMLVIPPEYSVLTRPSRRARDRSL